MKSILSRIDTSKTWSQLIPLVLTLVVFVSLITLLHASILLFNAVPFSQPIILHVRWVDALVGVTVYLKTSIDFAILMGRLMATYPGWRGRVAIEIGTAFGNAAGTIVVIGLWVLLKHIDILLALMIFIASLVLFELAHGSLEQLTNWEKETGVKRYLFLTLHRFLDSIKKVTDPVLARVMPDIGENLKGRLGLTWAGLLVFSITVPFILGLDDFAGYVPLFSVVNVYGFAIGVIAAHTMLNIALFISPQRTITVVKNEYVGLVGALVFIGLGIYGLVEVTKILTELF